MGWISPWPPFNGSFSPAAREKQISKPEGNGKHWPL